MHELRIPSYLGVSQMIQRLLICGIGLLKIFHHQIAMACVATSQHSYSNGRLSSPHSPRLPQTSPLLPSSLSIICRYSTARGKFSLVRRMHEMALRACKDW